jgi:hypothetical protein
MVTQGSFGSQGNSKQMKKTLEEKFWSQVEKTDGCWVWKGCIEKYGAGYGVLTYNGKREKVHRISWRLAYGPIPDGMKVCHTCDNKPCVRPDHFFLGTHLDNMRDMIRKGRCNRRGEANGFSLLTTNQVMEIKKELLNYHKGLLAELAQKYHVAKVSISSIKCGRNWAFVNIEPEVKIEPNRQPQLF